MQGGIALHTGKACVPSDFQCSELLFRKHRLARPKVALSIFPRLNTLSRKPFYHMKSALKNLTLPGHLTAFQSQDTEKSSEVIKVPPPKFFCEAGTWLFLCSQTFMRVIIHLESKLLLQAQPENIFLSELLSTAVHCLNSC